MVYYYIMERTHKGGTVPRYLITNSHGTQMAVIEAEYEAAALEIRARDLGYRNAADAISSEDDEYMEGSRIKRLGEWLCVDLDGTYGVDGKNPGPWISGSGATEAEALADGCVYMPCDCVHGAETWQQVVDVARSHADGLLGLVEGYRVVRAEDYAAEVGR